MKNIKTKLNDFLSESYYTTPPTFDRLIGMDGVKNFTNDKYKIVRFAYDDEGNNGFALLDIDDEKIISWSLTGTSQFIKYGELMENKTKKYLVKFLDGQGFEQETEIEADSKEDAIDKVQLQFVNASEFDVKEL